MIKTELVTVGGRACWHTWSDRGMLIERNGVRYSEAYDPPGRRYIYRETDMPAHEEVSRA